MTNRRKQRGGLRPDKYLSWEEEKRVRDHIAERARGGSYRDGLNQMIVLMLLDSGLRPTELTYVSIADTPAGHGKDVIWVDDGKGRIDRVVDIPSDLGRSIRRFVKLHRKGAKPASPLLTSEAGVRRRLDRRGNVERSSRLSYDSLYKRVVRIGRSAGVRLYPYRGRHTFGTKVYGVKGNLIFTRDQMGHASTRTTEIYAKTRSEERRREIEQLNTPLFSQKRPENIEQVGR